jgi:hypothetical protein
MSKHDRFNAFLIHNSIHQVMNKLSILNSRICFLGILIFSMLQAIFATSLYAAPAPTDIRTTEAAYANSLLDSILAARRHPAHEEGPTHEGDIKLLINLEIVGWEETFKRLSQGRDHSAFISVLSTPFWIDSVNNERTKKLMRLLADKEFSKRAAVPQIVAKLDVLNGNQLLEPYLKDTDVNVRTTCVTAMKPALATNSIIDKMIENLEVNVHSVDTDPASQLRIQSVYFLERASGHVVENKFTPSELSAAWRNWWNDNKERGLEVIIKAELTRCAQLLTNPNEELRERAGMPLICHSAQTYYGFHNKGTWWGVHDGEKSKECWLKWLKLRYDVREHIKTTRIEDEFNIKHPEISLSVLRATIAMHVSDLDSTESSVRSLARYNICSLLDDLCPFRMCQSDREDDWLNAGIKLWWEARMKALE